MSEASHESSQNIMDSISKAKDTVLVSFKNAKVKTKNFNRGRMKITVNLSKEEAEGFVNFKKAMLPEGANETEFLKTIFFMGLDQFHKNAINMMQKYVAENEEKLREDGVDVDAIKKVGLEITGNADDDSQSNN